MITISLEFNKSQLQLTTGVKASIHTQHGEMRTNQPAQKFPSHQPTTKKITNQIILQSALAIVTECV